jgi:hypothetical protein
VRTGWSLVRPARERLRSRIALVAVLALPALFLAAVPASAQPARQLAGADATGPRQGTPEFTGTSPICAQSNTSYCVGVGAKIKGHITQTDWDTVLATSTAAITIFNWLKKKVGKNPAPSGTPEDAQDDHEEDGGNKGLGDYEDSEPEKDENKDDEEPVIYDEDTSNDCEIWIVQSADGGLALRFVSEYWYARSKGKTVLYLTTKGIHNKATVFLSKKLSGKSAKDQYWVLPGLDGPP